MISEPFYCDASPTSRHLPFYEDGRIVHIAGSPLLTTCQHCGSRLERAHVHSPWWSAMRERATEAK